MSVEGNIIANIRTTLQSITAGATYTNTMKAHQVEARAQFEDEIPEDAYPHFSIVFKDSTREKEPGQIKKILGIDIVASFLSPTSTQVEPWLADIEKALSVDHTRGGYAYETWVPSMTRNSDVLDEIQIYIITVEVRTLAAYGSL